MASAGVPLRNRCSEAQEALGSVGESPSIGLEAAGPRFIEDLDGESDEARVPFGDTSRVEGEPVGRRAGLDVAPDLARVGQPVLVLPRAGELDPHDLRRRALDVKRPRAFHGSHARSSRHAEAAAAWEARQRARSLNATASSSEPKKTE